MQIKCKLYTLCAGSVHKVCNMNTITIAIRSFDKASMKDAADKLLQCVTGVHKVNYIGIPTHHQNFSLLRSPHGNKDSREEYSLHTYKAVMKLKSSHTLHDLLSDIRSIPLYGVQLQLRCTHKVSVRTLASMM